MKQTDNIKLIHAEKMFGDSTPSIPLDETYADFSVESLFKEYKKAIPDLMVDQTQKQELKIKQLEVEKSELQTIKEDNAKILQWIQRQEEKKNQ